MAKKEQKSLKIQAKKEIEKAANLVELNDAFKKYLGKKGELTQVLKSLKDLPAKKKKDVGEKANVLKKEIEGFFDIKKRELVAGSRLRGEWVDITAPGKKPLAGHLHPMTLTKRKIEEIFQLMGFSIVEGPDMETERYAFDALNIPKDHPSRDQWDTFYLSNDLVLRPHTSPVQIRHMEKNQPPVRIIVPGNCYRHEATDASHEFQLYQVEGLMVDKDVSVAHFKAIIQKFYQDFFDKPVKIRLIPSFFPFVEPGFQVDMSCVNCEGEGCSVCSQTGWLEMMGAGMVHPNVLKNSGLNPKFWQGFAFGMGMERLAMMKYKIDDIRRFRSGDLRFLKQFK